jgi:hypothetical protein
LVLGLLLDSAEVAALVLALTNTRMIILLTNCTQSLSQLLVYGAAVAAAAVIIILAQDLLAEMLPLTAALAVVAVAVQT